VSPPRACVIKKVLPNLVANRAFVGRFLDEAKVVVRLSHHNIARVYAMGDVNGEYFLSMEYVQGKTVSRFTKRLRDRKVEMPLGLILFIGEMVCEGLQYAHEARDERNNPLALVHRDLSPANVCISYRGEVKIIDFGAAQSTLKEEQTAPRVVIGNLTYMSPEQAKKQIVDGRADLYSCGVMLWELLAWHALPQKGDPIERWRKAANPTWEAPSLHHASLPTQVDEVILKALRKEPRDRYLNAAQFGSALRALRMKLAPNIGQKDLADLLSRAFHREKVAEDAVLSEVVYGKTVVDASREKTRRRHVVPPTALAFEHTAVLAPEDFLPNDQDSTDPGGAPRKDDAPRLPPAQPLFAGVGPPKRNKPQLLVVSPTRTSFGMRFDDLKEPIIERSLIQEIDAIGVDDEPPSGDGTREFGQSQWKMGLLFSGIFIGAVGLGFLAVWFSLR
jgi:serine/threonine-protein kinase